MSNCCIISIGWLTSLVYSSVHLVMSLVSHCLLYTHHVHLILLLRLCVDMDDIPALCMTAYCMTTFLLHLLVACLCGVHMYPLISKPLVSVDFVSLGFVFAVGDLLLIACFSTKLVTGSKASDELYPCL